MENNRKGLAENIELTTGNVGTAQNRDELITGNVGTAGNAAGAGTGGMVTGASGNATRMKTFFKKQAKAQSATG